MSALYNQMAAGKKISLAHSMRILTQDFLQSYNGTLNEYANDEDVLNDLFFYWLRQSAEKGYSWCNELDEQVFSEGFIKDMKMQLSFVFNKISICD